MLASYCLSPLWQRDLLIHVAVISESEMHVFFYAYLHIGLQLLIVPTRYAQKPCTVLGGTRLGVAQWKF